VIYALSTVVSFVAVFLKVFQQKNVIGGHLKLVVLTSYLIASFDVATVVLIIRGGWPIALSSGTGAAIGAVTALKLHDRWFSKPKPEPEGARARTRLPNQPMTPERRIELETALLTCDGKGREAKTKALRALIEEAKAVTTPCGCCGKALSVGEVFCAKCHAAIAGLAARPQCGCCGKALSADEPDKPAGLTGERWCKECNQNLG
jgi:hypothetical protein